MRSTQKAPSKESSFSDESIETVYPWVWIRSVNHAFESTKALADVNLSVERGGRVGIVGPSGCGKSTLLEIVGGLINPTEGTVAVGGAGTGQERLKRCGLMPQKDLLLPWRDALDNACLGLENQGVDRRGARLRAEPYFERFGLGEFEHARVWELSGGMRQRVAFLRTLLTGKQVLLLDEPFGALDSITRSQMQDWLAGALAQEPRTVLLVTHDVEEALVLCTRIAVLSARPGTVIKQLEVKLPRDRPHRELVTSPEFVALKEAALEALEC